MLRICFCVAYLLGVASCFVVLSKIQREPSARLATLLAPVDTQGESALVIPSEKRYSPNSRRHHEDDPRDTKVIEAVALSRIGQSVLDCLRERHDVSEGILWSFTTGAVAGSFHITPTMVESAPNPNLQQDDWFPAKLGEILSRCDSYADVMSLQPPDGVFLSEFRKAIHTISTKRRQNQRPVTIRLVFGHMLGCRPIDCDAVVQELTRGLPDDTTIRLWVAAWRHEWCCWNHAKLIAVDGRWVHTGGHNLWSQHYLHVNPLHDLSVELTGNVAHEGHVYANAQWSFIKDCLKENETPKASRPWSWISKSIATVASFPVTSSRHQFPSPYTQSMTNEVQKNLPRKINNRSFPQQHVPMLTIGRFHPADRSSSQPPSNDAISALLGSARSSIRLAIQDLGPRCWPRTQMAYPGHPWPTHVLTVLARAIWSGHVQVDIVVSNREAVCGGLPVTETLARPNGWSVQQVVDKIKEAIHQEYPVSRNDQGRQRINARLRVCAFQQYAGNTFADGTKMGLHTKCFVVDDAAFYVVSQNLYVCKLAEWGVIVDDRSTTEQLLREYWNPLWKRSYG